jgi:hypothetical protein
VQSVWSSTGGGETARSLKSVVNPPLPFSGLNAAGSGCAGVVRPENRGNLIFAGNYRQKGTTMKKTIILIAALAMFTVTARGISADGPIPPDPQPPRLSEVRWLVADGPIPPDPQPPNGRIIAG